MTIIFYFLAFTGGLLWLLVLAFLFVFFFAKKWALRRVLNWSSRKMQKSMMTKVSIKDVQKAADEPNNSDHNFWSE